jgi:copper chaperone CopZ
MTTREFTIEGMMCQGCADNVTGAIAKIPGVQSAKVSLAGKRAVVVADPSRTPSDKIEAAVAAAGYKAKVCNSR